MKITSAKDYEKYVKGPVFGGNFAEMMAEGRQYRQNFSRVLMLGFWSAVVDDEFEQVAREIHDLYQQMFVLNLELKGDIEQIAPAEFLENFKEWMRPGTLSDYKAIVDACQGDDKTFNSLAKRELSPLQIAELGAQVSQLLPSGVSKKQRAAAQESCRQKLVEQNSQSPAPCSLRATRKIIRTTLEDEYGSLVRRKQRQKAKESKRKAASHVDVVPSRGNTVATKAKNDPPQAETYGITPGRDGRSLTIHADQDTIKDVLAAVEGLGKDYEPASKEVLTFRELLADDRIFQMAKPNLSMHTKEKSTSKSRANAGQAAALLHCTLFGAAAFQDPERLQSMTLQDPREISLTVDPDQGRIIRGRNQFKRVAGPATFAHDKRGHWTLSDHGLRRLAGQGLSIKIRLAHSTEHEPKDQDSPVPSEK